MEEWRSLNASVDYELNEASRFFYQWDLHVRPCMEAEFKDELERVDFKSDPEKARQFINEWVSNQTSYQINELLGAADLEDDTKLVLVSTQVLKLFKLFAVVPSYQSISADWVNDYGQFQGCGIVFF